MEGYFFSKGHFQN